MKTKFADVLRIEWLAHTPDKRRVYYQPLNMELGMLHNVEGRWHAYSYEGTRLPLAHHTDREAALSLLTAWVSKAVGDRPCKILTFSEN